VCLRLLGFSELRLVGQKGKCAFSLDRRARNGNTCSKPGAGGYADMRAPSENPGLVVPRTNEPFTMYDDRRRFSGNTAELAVRYVRNKASNYSPLTKGGYRGVLGRGDPAGLGRKITPPTPPSQGGDEFAISTTTVGYS